MWDCYKVNRIFKNDVTDCSVERSLTNHASWQFFNLTFTEFSLLSDKMTKWQFFNLRKTYTEFPLLSHKMKVWFLDAFFVTLKMARSSKRSTEDENDFLRRKALPQEKKKQETGCSIWQQQNEVYLSDYTPIYIIDTTGPSLCLI